MNQRLSPSSFLNRGAALLRRAAPIVAVACAASMLTLAIRPSDAPTTGKSYDVESVLGAPGDILDRRGEAFREGRLGPITEEEWREAERFFSDYSPARVKEIHDLPDGERRNNQKRMLVIRYRALQKVKAESTELYNTRLQEVKVNDQVFRLCLEIKHGGGRDTSRLRSELSARVTELFDLGLVDRKIQISQVEKNLGKQRDLLTADEANKVALAKGEYERILVQGVEGARLDVGSKRPLIKPKPNATTAPSSPGEISPGEQ